MQNAFKEYLDKTVLDVEKTLNSFLNNWREEVKKTSPKLIKLTDDFIDSCQGGKRIRGGLVKLGFLLVDGDQKMIEEVLKASAAYEIFQTAILAHDDIIDKSPLRRGKPSLYRKLGGDHYGISQAMILSDIGFFLSVKLINETSFSDNIRSKALQSFTNSFLKTCLGELLDVELSNLKNISSDKDVYIISSLKTAHYTITGPLELGVILAGVEDKELFKNIFKFGEDIGIAFQIQDDILGVFGSEDKVGKSIVSDVEEGKNTLLIINALKNSNPEQKQALKKFYGKNNLTYKELNLVRRIFEETGALGLARQEINIRCQKAQSLIPKITKDLKIQRLLQDLTVSLVERIS